MTIDIRSMIGHGIRSLAIGLMLAFAVATRADANFINLVLEKPDIGSGFITTSYTSGTQTLSATGTAFTFTDAANVTSTITGGGFSLSATVDSSGNATGGSLNITGTIAGSPGFASPLLQGTLASVATANSIGYASNFGFGFLPDPDTQNPPSTSAIFEFIFDVTGGSLKAQYGPLAGVILSQVNIPLRLNNSQGFGTSWTSDGLGVSDTGVVPVPAAAWLFGTALVALASVARRRHSSS